MNYKYSPIYKYGILFVVIYMFLKYQRIIPNDKLLLNSIVITLIIVMFDYMFIDEHPFIFGEDETQEVEEHYENENENKIETDETNANDIEEIINSYDSSIEQELYNDQNIQNEIQPYNY